MARPTALRVALACFLAVVCASARAQAGSIVLVQGTSELIAPYYVGSINDGIPSSELNEATYINYLITLAAGAGDTQIPEDTGEFYNRIGSSVVSLPTAIAIGAVKVDAELSPGVPNPAFSVSGISMAGFTYILAKYDAGKAGSLVWLVSGVNDGEWDGTVTLPTEFNGYGISHYTTFTSVPDGGATLMLLGGALVGLGVLRRRFRG